MILSGENTGVDQSMIITQSGGDGGLAALEYDPGNGLNALTEATAAQDALVRIDGFDVQSASNTVTGAIGGVTIDLVKVAVGEPTTLLVENDTDAVRQLFGQKIADARQLTDQRVECVELPE